MKITVIGLGHLGAVIATGLAASRRHHVTGVDTDHRLIEILKEGRAHFHEHGLHQGMAHAIRGGHLRFSHTDEANDDLGEIAIIATGTPANPNGGADLTQVRNALAWIADRNPKNLTIVMKSTVPPGSGLTFLNKDLANLSVGYVANPEFLREGTALHDWLNPEQIILGVMPDDDKAIDTVCRMYQGITAPILATDITSAEMLKYASNSFLATRISFINEMATICDAVGASIDAVAQGLALDPRTGTMMRAGVGYGGSCLPKDTIGLHRIAHQKGVNPTLLTAVSEVNRRQTELPMRKLSECFARYIGPNMKGLTVGVLGLAFKPGTNDVRGAVAIKLINDLVERGVRVRAYDPVASGEAMRHVPESVEFMARPEQVATGAKALILLTEWTQIIEADWGGMAQTMYYPRFLFDGRNALDPVAMRELGFMYTGIGRGLPA